MLQALRSLLGKAKPRLKMGGQNYPEYLQTQTIAVPGSGAASVTITTNQDYDILDAIRLNSTNLVLLASGTFGMTVDGAEVFPANTPAELYACDTSVAPNLKFYELPAAVMVNRAQIVIAIAGTGGAHTVSIVLRLRNSKSGAYKDEYVDINTSL